MQLIYLLKWEIFPLKGTVLFITKLNNQTT